MQKKIDIKTQITICALGICLSACDLAIIGENEAIRIKDKIVPEINITRPQDGGHYAANVLVEGMVTDKADIKGTAGGIDSRITWEVLGTKRTGEAAVAGNGLFSFTFSTTGFTGDKTLKITALDWNGNVGTTSLSLLEGAFPHFRVEAWNTQVLLHDWDTVDLAESYTLFYTNDGSIPSETNTLAALNVDPEDPGAFGLLNGKLYSFILRANTDGAGTSWSDVVQAIPVSEFTLAPRVTGGYREIRLEWYAIDGTNRFIVGRSTAPAGAFTEYPVTGFSWKDTQAEDGIVYYYRVRPNLEANKDRWSYAIPGETTPVAPFGQTVSSYTGATNANRVVINGDYACIADEDEGLCIVDISDPFAPSPAGACSVAPAARALAINGNYAYIAADGGWLKTVDISDPRAPVLLNFENPYAGERTAVDVALAGQYAFLSIRYYPEPLILRGGVEVVDISDPANPQPVTLFPTPGPAQHPNGIALDGQYAFVARSTDGLAVYDISTLPLAPVARGTLAWGLSACDVAVAGNLAYVACSTENRTAGQLAVIDVSNPDAPVRIGYCNLEAGASVIVLDGDFAYTACEAGGIIMINISDPAHPYVAGVYDPAFPVAGCAVRGRFAFLACAGNGLQVINAGTPYSLQTLTTYAGAAATTRQVAVNGVFAYAADSSGYLHTLGISQPASPVIYPPLAIPGAHPSHIALCGNYAYLTGNYTGVKIVSLEDPAHPQLAGSIDIPGNTLDACLFGDYLYVAWENSSPTGVKIYDIAWPESPDFAGEFNTTTSTGMASAVAVKGNHAFTAAYATGLNVQDISDPAAPLDIITIATSDPACDVEVYGNYAVVAVRYAGIQLIGIPEAVARQETVFTLAIPGTGCATDTALCGSYALIADGTTGLAVANLTDPRAPLLTGIWTAGSGAAYINTWGRYGFLSLPGTGVRIIDLWPYAL